jgi:hypothetical protein
MYSLTTHYEHKFIRNPLKYKQIIYYFDDVEPATSKSKLKNRSKNTKVTEVKTHELPKSILKVQAYDAELVSSYGECF